MSKIYINDEIKDDIIEKLKPGRNYLIGAEPGSGKTTWVEETLLPHCIKNQKKVLFLCHRKSLRNMIIKDLEKYDYDMYFVNIMLYQELEQRLLHKNFINEYDFIVCDEIHYVVTDASFNRNTELVFDMLNEKESSVNIFLTGTPNPLLHCKWDNPYKTLRKPNRKNHNVKNVYLCREQKFKWMLYKRLENNEKLIMFVSNAKEGKETVDNLKLDGYDARFICSDTNKLNKYSDKDIKKQIEDAQQFDCQIVVMTSVMNTGISIKDGKITTIFLHGINSITDIHQSVARVRINDDVEKINVVIMKPKNVSLATRIRVLENDLLYIDDVEQWEQKNKRSQVPYFVYRDKGEFKINQMTVAKYRNDYKELNDMIRAYGLKRVLKNMFPKTNIIDVDLNDVKGDVIEQLEKIIEKPLDKSEQERIKILFNKNESLNDFYEDAELRKGRVNTPKNINIMLEHLESDLSIVSKKEGKGNKTYWYVRRG